MVTSPRLILASASPRRQELLKEAGYTFTVYPADIDEDDVPPDLLPADLAEYLARAKAAVISERFPQDVVLAADTVVAHAETLLGKPRDAADARRMLTLLGGTIHTVVTGVAVVHAAASFARHARVISSVHMRPLTSDEITQYVATNEWQGKAGGYGIQDPDPFVTRIAGCHTNIVGLPMHMTAELLAAAGIMPGEADGSSLNSGCER
jgi:septum formation protein